VLRLKLIDMNSETPTHVVKVGGSLFTYENLQPQLLRWLNEQKDAHHVLVPGGGPIVDAIREIDRVSSLGEEFSHWLCIDALDLTARLLEQLLPDARLVSSVAELHKFVADAVPQRIAIFAPSRFLCSEEPQAEGNRLAHGWDVTSDSIAARLCEMLNADRLILLKSSDAPVQTRIAASQCGYVDRFFETAARNLSEVVWVNLRDSMPKSGWLT
jgi:aspartokinase-like uncharacterized kinase